MDRLLDYMDRVCNSSSIASLWDVHCNEMKRYGFDRLLYGFSHFMTAKSIGPREDFLVLYSHSADYMRQLFGDEELYRHSPMLNWALNNTGSCSWGWVHDNINSLNAKEKIVHETNRALNVTAGYTISFPETSKNARGLIALAAEDGLSQEHVDATWAKHGKTIEAMNNLAHLKIMSLPQQTDRMKLSKRQREALEWVGNGKTNQDIASIMGVSPATVEKHLRIAREKLGVDTTAQAILKISYWNQIHSLDG